MSDSTQRQQPPSPREAARLLSWATRASVAVALVLIIAKGLAWAASGSVSLLASLVDSCLDGLASLVNLVAVRHALSPADREHRFGHGKAEALAGLGQAALIVLSAGFLLVEAVRRLQDPVAPQAQGLGVAVMLFSIAATLALVLFQRHVVRRTNSTAIMADSLHYRADLLVNASVILALWLSARGWPGYDALFALAIGGYILYSAWEILRQAFDHLMDRELPDDERERIVQIALAHEAVCGLHDLRSRRSGTTIFMQLHLELEDDLTLLAAHGISDEVEERLLEAYPGAQILIHIDPISVVPEESQPAFLSEEAARPGA